MPRRRKAYRTASQSFGPYHLDSLHPRGDTTTSPELPLDNYYALQVPLPLSRISSIWSMGPHSAEDYDSRALEETPDGEYEAPPEPVSPALPNALPDLAASFDERHPRFYFSDGSIIFTAGGRLYRVHRHAFDSSDVLSAMVADARTGVPGEEKGNIFIAAHPVYIGSLDAAYDVSEADIESLLEVLYPGFRFSWSDYGCGKLQGVLRCADKWGFSDIRQHCLQLLQKEPLTITDKLTIGAEYDVQGLVLDAFVDVCCDIAAPNEEVMNTLISNPALGVGHIVRLFSARERVRSRFQALTRWRDYYEEAEDTMFKSLRDAMDLVSHPPLHIRDYIAKTTQADPSKIAMFLEMEQVRDLVSSIVWPVAPPEAPRRQSSLGPGDLHHDGT